MASLRIVVHEESGKFLGHRIIPIDAIQSGQRSEERKTLNAYCIRSTAESSRALLCSLASFLWVRGAAGSSLMPRFYALQASITSACVARATCRSRCLLSLCTSRSTTTSLRPSQVPQFLLSAVIEIHTYVVWQLIVYFHTHFHLIKSEWLLRCALTHFGSASDFTDALFNPTKDKEKTTKTQEVKTKQQNAAGVNSNQPKST